MGLRQRAAEALHGLPLGIHHATPPEVRQLLRHSLGRYYAWEMGYDHHHTPELQPGEESGPPGFVGIGVQKAGTSWWYQLITSHPEVSSRPDIHKERHFFARFGTEAFGPSDIADYHAWFPRAVGTIGGEWTPDYFYYPWVPSLVAQAAPEAKLLLILRDPVQRFRSGLARQIHGRADHVGRTLAVALGRSLYADSLRRWRKWFPADQLLVMQYEACAADPVQELVRTYEFLGLDSSYRPSGLHHQVNKTQRVKASLPADALERICEVVAPDIAALAALLPELDLSLWPSARRSHS